MKVSMFPKARRMPALHAMILMLAAASFAAPVVAQQQAPVTRAQVRAELAELRAAGYNPSDKIHYPDNLWAAQQRVQVQHASSALANGQSAPQTHAVADTSSAAVTNEAVGGAKSGTSMSGSRRSVWGPSTCQDPPTCALPYKGR